MIATVSTRIGIVFLLIFLVQILTSMYRYTVRLSAFYDAAADAMSAQGEAVGGLNLAQIMEILTPRHLDFSSGPRPPTDRVVELLTSALERREHERSASKPAAKDTT